MRLKKYLPEFVSNIKEFQELDKTISLEVDELRNKLEQLQENQFIETADKEGLRKYEQLLNLNSINDIELRRFNILNKYNSTIPFSMMWLRNTLNTTIGRGDFLVELDNQKYTLTISVVKKNHIKYVSKSVNRNESLTGHSAKQSGAERKFGSVYYIYVHKRDYEEACALIEKIK